MSPLFPLDIQNKPVYFYCYQSEASQIEPNQTESILLSLAKTP